MTEKPFEIDIEVTEKGPEVTPFAGLVPFERGWCTTIST
jgi:hypothetical protein